MKAWPRGTRRRLLALLGSVYGALPAQAELTTATAPSALSTQARLDFTININKFLYLRVGNTGAGNINTVSFAITPSIPIVPTAPIGGNNVAVNWSGGAPNYTVAASGNVLPVEVQSNAGAVTLRAAATTLLTSGANTIPMSQITVSSSDSALPAPPLPDTATPGTSVIVTGTSFSNLVTVRNANWIFSYAPVAPAAGNYAGQVTFTASAP